MKDFFIFILFFVFIQILYSQEKSNTIIIDETLMNNTSIQQAMLDYENSIIEKETNNGIFIPYITLGSSLNITENVDNRFDAISSYMSITEKLPGNLTVSFNSNYSNLFSNIDDKVFISQFPNFSISLSQSFLPFWIQGKNQNPETLELQFRKEYYYTVLQNTKIEVIKKLFQTIFFAKLNILQLEVIEDNICFLEKEKKIYEDLYAQGAINYVELIDIQQSVWKFNEEYGKLMISYEQNIEEIKSICNSSEISSDIENILFNINFKKLPNIKDLLNVIQDPMDKLFILQLQLLDNKAVLERQNSAPKILVQLQPKIIMPATEKDKWFDAWRTDIETTWKLDIGIDLNDFIHSSIRKDNKKNENEYYKIKAQYDLYLVNKDNIQNEYEKLIHYFDGQFVKAKNLYEQCVMRLNDKKKELELGKLSEIEYERILLETKIQHKSLESIELYKYYYLFLINLYK